MNDAVKPQGCTNLKLRELDGQKDEFLSQVSHEVRTPMASIRSCSLPAQARKCVTLVLV